jgi:hypothetical protein
MQTVNANWEDAENNRHVAFSVAFSRQENAIQIHSVTPQQVTFLCPETRNPVRTIGVWTDKGRALLKDQIHESGRLSQLENELEASLAV